MQLREVIQTAGMTAPKAIVPGKWMRFPGAGKGRANRAGWCRLITPTLAIYGDWSTGLSEVWRDESHCDDDKSRRALDDARRRERAFAAAQRRKQHEVALEARRMVAIAKTGSHPYLARKGFSERKYLTWGSQLLVPMRDAFDYGQVVNVQLIAEDGTKRFLTGGRAGGAVLALGSSKSRHTVLCEGYATGLSLEVALQRLPGPNRVVVCFSACNLQRIARAYPGAYVAADNDRSATGERAAQNTGLKWTMPYDVGTDFNDLHREAGLHVVVERMRDLLIT